MSGICSAHRGHNPSCSRCMALPEPIRQPRCPHGRTPDEACVACQLARVHADAPSTPEGKLATVEAMLGAGLLRGCPWCGGTNEHEHGVCAGRLPATVRNPDSANGAADQDSFAGEPWPLAPKPDAEAQRLREQLAAADATLKATIEAMSPRTEIQLVSMNEALKSVVPDPRDGLTTIQKAVAQERRRCRAIVVRHLSREVTGILAEIDDGAL